MRGRIIISHYLGERGPWVSAQRPKSQTTSINPFVILIISSGCRYIFAGEYVTRPFERVEMRLRL